MYGIFADDAEKLAAAQAAKKYVIPLYTGGYELAAAQAAKKHFFYASGVSS
tara:strand:+ start:174 stop:326 length:153 start_codon:yes stop_codon:yes gene_type:complete